MKREESMRESPEAHVQYWKTRAAGAAAGSIAAFEAKMALAIAKYSAGESLDAVRVAVQAAVAELALERTPIPLRLPEHYFPALWALSLSIVFGDPSTALVQRMVGQDLLVDRLLQLTHRGIAPTGKLLHPKAMQHLLAAMDAPKAAVPAVEAFLENWYDSMGPTPWHDTHLRQDPAFFGYWAFELAAVVKTFHISDGPFSKHSFYPKEIVHQRAYKPWIDDGKTPPPEIVQETKDRVEAVQALLKTFLAGGSLGTSAEKSLDENLKSLGRMVTSAHGEGPPQDPEAMRLGFLHLLKSVATMAQEARLPENATIPAEQIAAMREMEQELLAANPELEDLNNTISSDPQSPEIQKQIAENQERLLTIHDTIESMLQDQAIELEQLFDGIEALHERLYKDMGIEPEPPLDIYKEVSEQVGKSLDEACKKNMITADFDWSSLWRKD